MKKENHFRGASLTTILLVVFITLKLTHLIDWSWWAVLIPLWIELGVAALLLIILGIAFLVENK